MGLIEGTDEQRFLRIRESDGSPSVAAVNQIIFPNGSVTNNGNGTVTIAFPASGVSSVSNVDQSLIFSPNTGDVIGSLNPVHANNWTGQQKFYDQTGGMTNDVGTVSVSQFYSVTEDRNRVTYLSGATGNCSSTTLYCGDEGDGYGPRTLWEQGNDLTQNHSLTFFLHNLVDDTFPYSVDGNTVSIFNPGGASMGYTLGVNGTFYAAGNFFTGGAALISSSLTVSSLTAGRVPFITTSGLISDSTDFLYNGTNTLSVSDSGTSGGGALILGRSTVSFAQTAAVFFNTGGNNKFSFGLLNSNDTDIVIKDASGNIMLQVTDAGAVGNLTVSGVISSYKGVVTTGYGVPAIYKSDRATAQTGAKTLAAYTVGSVDGSFEVSANVLVTTATLHSFTVTVTYTDEGNTSRTVTLNFSTLAGAITPTIANAGGAVPYEGVPLHIRCKAGTTITIASTGTFTTVTYNIEECIKQIA